MTSRRKSWSKKQDGDTESENKMNKIVKTLNGIGPLDLALQEQAQIRLDSLTKPQGSLGRLEELAKLLVGITKRGKPALRHKVIFTLAADHGVAKEGISAFPQEVTAQMVYNFLRGGAAINVLASHVGCRVVVADLGVAADLKAHPKLIINKINYGTKNMAEGPAMTREEAVKSIEAGIDIFEREFRKGVDIVGTGDMGIANTTSSSAIAALLTKTPVEDVTGRGTGCNDETLHKKIKTIKKALSTNNPDASDPLDVLSKVGGFEIGGLTGIMLAAAARRVPIVLDGFISGAAALIACALKPVTKNYMIASHNSVEKGHRIILKYLGFAPLFDLNLRLGEGTGACLGIALVEAAVKILTQMATFQSAGISEKNN